MLDLKYVKELIEKEGNKKAFKYKGYECRILRHPNPNLIHLCGYVALPKEHKYYSKSYTDEDMPYFNVHGGLTYSDFKLRSETLKDVLWIGFDCAHAGDIFSLRINSPCISKDDYYKDMKYVKKEIKKLVDELLIKQKNNYEC